jgi:hypothetical protein
VAAQQGRLYQQRFELDESRYETNLVEVEITHVIGSGKHAVTYLYLAPSGELTELSMTRYSQERRWAISAGYEQVQHNEFSRDIDYGCIFCHNGYINCHPKQAVTASSHASLSNFRRGSIASDVHGPGERHIALASAERRNSVAVRTAIVNPA